MNDRAKGYLLKGVVKNAITNYGNFTWDEHPADYGGSIHLPNVSIPGRTWSEIFLQV